MQVGDFFRKILWREFWQARIVCLCKEKGKHFYCRTKIDTQIHAHIDGSEMRVCEWIKARETKSVSYLLLSGERDDDADADADESDDDDYVFFYQYCLCKCLSVFFFALSLIHRLSFYSLWFIFLLFISREKMNMSNCCKLYMEIK